MSFLLSVFYACRGSPSEKQMRARDMLLSFGNSFVVKLVIHYEIERV